METRSFIGTKQNSEEVVEERKMSSPEFTTHLKDEYTIIRESETHQFIGYKEEKCNAEI